MFIGRKGKLRKNKKTGFKGECIRVDGYVPPRPELYLSEQSNMPERSPRSAVNMPERSSSWPSGRLKNSKRKKKHTKKRKKKNTKQKKKKNTKRRR
jgi:hypothetical protein